MTIKLKSIIPKHRKQIFNLLNRFISNTSARVVKKISKNSSKKNLVEWIFIPVVIFSILMPIYVNYQKSLPIRFWDEFLWVGRGYFFDEYLKGNFYDEKWQTHQSYDQPKVAEYYYGITLYAKYINDKKTSSVDSLYNFLDKYSLIEDSNSKTKIPYKNTDSGNLDYYYQKYGPKSIETINLILEARRYNTVVLTLTAILVYFLGLKIKNSVFGILFSVVYGLNTLVVNTNLVAHSEVLFLLFFNASILTLSHLYSRKKVNKFLLLFFAILSGFCMSTKLNGAMLLIIFLILQLYSLLASNKKSIFLIRKRIQQSIAVVLISFLVFLILNPFALLKPIENTQYMLSYRMLTANGQAANYADLALKNPLSRLVKIFENYYVLETKNFNQIILVQDQPISKLYFKSTLFLLILGLFSSVSFRSRHKRKNKYFIFIISFFITMFVSILYIKIDWERYFVHLALFFLFFQTYGIYWLATKTIERLKQAWVRVWEYS